eukprot:gene9396-57055_t
MAEDGRGVAPCPRGEGGKVELEVACREWGGPGIRLELGFRLKATAYDGNGRVDARDEIWMGFGEEERVSASAWLHRQIS